MKSKKIARITLTCIQIFIALSWLMMGAGDEGFNAMMINILPIPNLGDMLIFGIAVLLIVGLEKLRTAI